MNIVGPGGGTDLQVSNKNLRIIAVAALFQCLIVIAFF